MITLYTARRQHPAMLIAAGTVVRFACLTALDLGEMIGIMFAGKANVQDILCAIPRADFDCDGFSTALDLGNMIDRLFANGPLPGDPCAP